MIHTCIYIYINIYYGIYTHFFLNILDIIQIYTECIYIYMPMTPLKRQALEQRLDAVEVGWDGHGFSIDKNHVGWLKPWGFTHSFVEQLCWETFTLIVFFKNPSWVLYIYIVFFSSGFSKNNHSLNFWSLNLLTNRWSLCCFLWGKPTSTSWVLGSLGQRSSDQALLRVLKSAQPNEARMM